MSNLPAPQHGFNSITQVTINGIEMGVLDNGIPYLTESGLAGLCAVDRKTISELASEYSQNISRPRVDWVRQKLATFGYSEPTLYLKAMNMGIEVNAYVPQVCVAILEYYAFNVSNPNPNVTNFYRSLVGVSFQEMIYRAVGYDPRQSLPIVWQQYTDRVSILADSVPDGYFSIFKETAGLLVDLINNGVPVGPSIMPDGSVGIGWAGHWNKIDGDSKFGQPIRYQHNFPNYFPQAKSNPQTPRAYPETALPEFRRWFREEYLPIKYPKYILGLKGKVSSDTAAKAIEAITGKQIALK